MTVHVYSRSPKVCLLLNGRLLGEQPTDKETYTATFEVPYEPGSLVARNVGKDKSEFALQTAGEPAKIVLSADRLQLSAGSQDLCYISIAITDAAGVVVPDAVVPLSISCTGDATVVAGNGSFDDMCSFRSLTPTTFRGRALAIVRPNSDAGTATVSVSAPGMTTESVTITMDPKKEI